MNAAEQDEVPLSVVIATRSGWEALSPILGTLLAQVRAVGGEVVVASGSAEAASPPRPARWIAVGSKDLVRLRSIALLASRGAVVAIGEDHAYPRPDWCHAILRAEASTVAERGGRNSALEAMRALIYRPVGPQFWSTAGYLSGHATGVLWRACPFAPLDRMPPVDFTGGLFHARDDKPTGAGWGRRFDPDCERDVPRICRKRSSGGR